jgi:hypothetical protein
MVIAAALIRKYSQCSARHAPLFAYFPNFGNNWQKETEIRLTESRRKAIGSSLEAERGGMAERLKAPVLKTGDP